MSLNDPRWGSNPGNQGDDAGRQNEPPRRPDQQAGPPDLEEVWRDIGQRMQTIFGGKGGGTGGGGGGPTGRSNLPRGLGGGAMIGIIVLAGLVWAASGIYTVDANERGVVLRFGHYLQTTEPGLRWRLPYPIESHEKVDLSGVRTVEVGYRGADRSVNLREAQMLTDDANIINIQFAVQYVLKSPEDYLFKNRFPDDSVIQAAETAMREIVGKSRMDFVLYEGREEIAATAHELMQTILDRYETGILISRVTMQNAQPPEQVQAAFDDAVKAGQDRERQRNEGEAYANSVVPLARGSAARILEEANAYRSRVVAEAEGEARRFDQVYAEYRLAPEVTRERLYLEAMADVLGRTNMVLIDTPEGNNVMMMPLDRLMQGAAAASASSAAPQPQAAPPATMAQPPQPAPASIGADPRDRNAFRNRPGSER